MRFIWWAMLCVALVSCTSARQLTTRTPLYLYRADVNFTVDGRSIPGLISIPRSQPTEIRIDSPVKMDVVRISSCNRDTIYEKVGNRGGWFSESGTSFIYNYTPNEVENEGLCPVYVQIFDANLMTAWGFVAFKTTEKLKAHVDCDGDSYDAEGMDSCQSMHGFEQGLRFDVPVKYTTRGPCLVVRRDDRTLRVSTTGPGFCALTAYDGKDFFKFTLLGYDELLVRGKPTAMPGGN